MSALFNKQGGILSVLKTNRESFTPKAKYLMLDFIAELVKKHHSKELSAVKKSAVHVLVALVEEKLLDSSALEAMIKRFMTSFIQNQSKLVSSVKCAILELFGASVRYYPDSFTIDKQDPEHIKRRLLTTMSTCINSSNPDMELLAGAVLGLGNYLYSFDITEAGLIFIKEHAEKFRLQICADRDAVLFIHGCLKNMSSHPNRDLHKLGYGCNDSILETGIDTTGA
ncbi:hypothetical protein BDR26DRAFT_897263 [Obelidium mucronatum]|nr:hypothetical protein BDR26DRAFT_897263 [Obelidium mucronatum]